MILRLFLFCVLSIGLYTSVFSQNEIIGASSGICPPIVFKLNKIQSEQLHHFYNKLTLLEQNKNGIVRVYHIGDSHTQPDIASGVVRTEFQKRFGNAGRGLIFPYQLAKSNPPDDILSSSSISSWNYNRVATPKKGINNGVCGFMIETTARSGNIKLQLDGPDSLLNFNNIKSFQEANPAVYWMLDSLSKPSSKVLDWSLSSPSKSINLSFKENQDTLRFFGAEVSNGKSGLMLNTIGVNGATFQQYNNNPKFWQQLAQLAPGDLYILSLGSNEADIPNIKDSVFMASVDTFVNRLKRISPQASILLTTVADYYVDEKNSNPVVLKINSWLEQLAYKRGWGLWDLLGICKGLGSAKYWIRCNLMSHDRVHFVTEGYQIQGKLLSQALLDGFRLHKTKK